MERLEARIRRNLKLIIMVLAAAAGLALGCQLDIALNKTNQLPDPLLLIAGLLVGLLVGWIANLLLRRPLVRPSLRLVSPFWIGMLALPVLVSGLIFWSRANVPMDWRPVIAIGLLAVLPGAGLGWLIAMLASRAVRRAEPAAIISQAAIRLTQDLQLVRQTYPGSQGQLLKTGPNFLAHIKVPRQREAMVFYVECGEEYPQYPPLSIGIELEVAHPGGNSTERVPYAAPIQGFWNPNYGLCDIINEALYITKH